MADARIPSRCGGSLQTRFCGETDEREELGGGGGGGGGGRQLARKDWHNIDCGRFDDDGQLKRGEGGGDVGDEGCRAPGAGRAGVCVELA